MAKYTLRNYVSYLRDNPKGYWFKRKLYGWGWVPARLQGWLVTLGFVLLLIANGLYLASFEVPSTENLIFFFSTTLIYLTLLIVICYKTGEKPKWTWER